jgi:dGTPase
MSIRKQTEEIERQTLHPRACLSAKSIGRLKTEKEGDIRTCFQRDRDRVIHSKAFRRLKHKTQVFLAPRGDHYRTRLTHVLEVSQIARTIARALRLNEDLTEAIALAHDLGHTPFGHAGETVLREIHPGGFEHYEQSLRVVDYLERDGKGLNLTHEVRDGIIKHSKGKGNILPKTDDERAITIEGQVVRVADTIAYLNHDMDDSLRAQVIKKSEVPAAIVKVLGDNYSDRIDRMVKDIVIETIKSQSMQKGTLRMSEDVLAAMYALRDFLYERVYESERTKAEFRKAHKILSDLYSYYLEHLDQVFVDVPFSKKANPHRIVCDFIAGMTDRFALMTYEDLFLPGQWLVY